MFFLFGAAYAHMASTTYFNNLLGMVPRKMQKRDQNSVSATEKLGYKDEGLQEQKGFVPPLFLVVLLSNAIIGFLPCKSKRILAEIPLPLRSFCVYSQ